MTRESWAKLLPAVTHWVNSGRLWWYDEGIWKEHKSKSLHFNADDMSSTYIIEDEFFDARKAFVEGKVVEYCSVSSGIWATCPNPLFNKGFRYRVKTPSPRELYKQRFDQAFTHLLGSYNPIGLPHLEKIDKCTRMANIYAIKSNDDILNLRLIKGIIDGGKKKKEKKMATLKELNVVLKMEDNYLDKVTYIPDHAKGNMGHEDVDQGVIINFSDDKVGVLFCKSRTVQRVSLSQLVWG